MVKSGKEWLEILNRMKHPMEYVIVDNSIGEELLGCNYTEVEFMDKLEKVEHYVRKRDTGSTYNDDDISHHDHIPGID